jgi:hypothetical protein
VNSLDTTHRHRRVLQSTMSTHAQKQVKDRSIPQAVVDAILDFGEGRNAGNGAESYQFSHKGWKRFATYLGKEARHFERYRNAYIVVASDGDVITACWQH